MLSLGFVCNSYFGKGLRKLYTDLLAAERAFAVLGLTLFYAMAWPGSGSL